MSASANTSTIVTDCDWLFVEPGLFEYPLGEGQKPVLLASRCPACGTTFFPRRTLCRHCLDEDSMENIGLDGTGVIYASTVVYVDSPAGIKAPYAFGYVDLPAHGIRVFALFTDADPSLLKPGREVELMLEPIARNAENKAVIGYKFRPVR